PGGPRGRQRQEVGHPAPGPGDGVDAGQRGRRQHGQPQATVAGEVLLRREVVGVGVGDGHRQSAGRRGGVDQDQRVTGALGPADRHRDAGGRLVVGPGDRVDGRVGLRLRGAARIGLDDHRIADERVLGHRVGELRAELAVGEVQRPLVDQPERGGVPERGGAAVAEDHLIAVGQREQFPDAVADPADQVLHRRLAVRGAEQIARRGQCLELFGPDFRRPGSEPTVTGFEIGGDLEFSHGDKGSDPVARRGNRRRSAVLAGRESGYGIYAIPAVPFDIKPLDVNLTRRLPMARTRMVRRWRRSMEVTDDAQYVDMLNTLSEGSVRRNFNPYIDIDWEAPEFAVTPDDERWILPATDPLGRHPWYQAQPVKKQIEIGMWRQANVAKVGLQIELILIRGLTNYAFWVPNGSPEYRYCLHETIEECNHTLMFQEMVNRIGADVPGMPRVLRWLAPFIPQVAGPLPVPFFFGVLAGEEPIDHTQKNVLREGKELHPIMERVMAIHVAEEARHISFAHEFLRKRLPRLNRRQRFWLSLNVPLIMRILCQAILVPPRS